MAKNYDIVIVGAGIAGLTAAIYAARAGKSVLVLESMVYGGQIVQTLDIANWPGEISISGPDLMKKTYTQATKLGVNIEYSEVEKISQADECLTSKDTKSRARRLWLVETEDEKYIAGAIIIATGTVPRKLSDKQTRDAGKRPISYCATCDGAFFKGKPVVVVGSGNTAKYEISYLKNIASKVYHIHHDDPIPSDAAAVFVAIGRVPATEFLKGFVKLDSDGYVIAGEDCHTSTPGVFVAGDCRTKSVRQLVTAAGDGAVAAAEAGKWLAR